MSELRQVVLQASSASLVGTELLCDSEGTTMCFEVVLEASAATLVGTLQFTGGITQHTSYPEFVAGAGFSQITQAPSGYNVGALATNGRLVFASPSTGRTSMVIKMTGLATRYIQPVWTYGSGGGTVKLVVTAYGFGLGTTP